MRTIPRLEEVRRELARRSLAEFTKQAWSIVEGDRPLCWGWAMDAICKHLEAVTQGLIKDLVINIPPKHSKSTLVSVMWPAWEWIMYPQRRWMFSSYSASLSRRDSLKCRRIITSEWYQRNWGPESGWPQAYTLLKEQNSGFRYDNDKTGYRMATTCMGAGTGHGGDRIVVDDPHSTLKVESETDRAARILWWQQVMSTRKDSPFAGRVVIMQRSHENDLTGYLIKNESTWELLCLPMRFEPERRCRTSIGFEDPRQQEGEILMPGRYSEKDVEELERALGSYAAAAQLQQRPAPRTGGMFRADRWRYYLMLPEAFDLVVDSWDMAFKDFKTSSYVCGQKWGFAGADAYLITQRRGQWDFVKTCQELESLASTPPIAPRKYVEDKANGPAVIQVLRSRVGGLLEFHPEDSKVGRANAVLPLHESGNLYLPQTAPWVADFVAECALFPQGRYSDQVDAMTQAILAARKLLAKKTVGRILPIESTLKPSLLGFSDYKVYDAR